jgi:hypothetical protein
MTLKIYFLIFYIQTFLSALIAVVCFYRYSERNGLIKLIGILFVGSFVCNMAGYLFFVFNFSNRILNIPNTVYDFILVFLASMLYNDQTRSKYKRAFTLIAGSFALMGILNLLFFQTSSITSYNKLLSSFILIGYAVIYFYRLMVELPTIHLHRLPMFWFNSAFLIYHAGTIFLFAFTPYLVSFLQKDMLSYWSFHNVLSIVQGLIILIGLTYDLKNIRNVPVRH